MISASQLTNCRQPRSWTLSLALTVATTVLALPGSAGAYVYWPNYDLGKGTTVGRANLDGTSANQSFITAASIPTAVAVDGQHVYWTNPLGGTIGRANLDGAGASEFFITGAGEPLGLAVDGQHVYWTSNAGNTIGRANLDGSSPDNNFITTPGSNPNSVAVDGQHVYWTTSGSIGRANLNGSSPDQTYIDLSGAAPNGVAVDGRHIYWTSYPGVIGRANLDGSDVEPSFILAGDVNPFGVAVDGQYIYWANEALGTIGRANLDGSASDPGFITGARYPTGVAVDSLPSATTTSVACTPAAVTPPAATVCTATVTDTAGFDQPAGTVDFGASGAGSFGPPASCSLITTGAAQSMCQQTFAPTADGIDSITAAYRGDTFNAASSGTAGLTVLGGHPPGKPANSFTLSRPKRGRRAGSSTLIATVPGAGTLLLAGKGVKKLTKSVSSPGRVTLTLRTDATTKRSLERTGTAKITVNVTFTPVGGDPNTKSKKITLRRGRR